MPYFVRVPCAFLLQARFVHLGVPGPRGDGYEAAQRPPNEEVAQRADRKHEPDNDVEAQHALVVVHLSGVSRGAREATRCCPEQFATAHKSTSNTRTSPCKRSFASSPLQASLSAQPNPTTAPSILDKLALQGLYGQGPAPSPA